MKFKNLFLFAAFVLLASCGKYEFDATQVNQEIAMQQARNQLGVEIDPDQNWRPIRHGSVTITANADLENIVRVELLTESPFGNEEATILSRKDCKGGQQVTLTYEAPDYLTELVAACVNDKGVYYITPFDIDDQTVDFNSANARRRATTSDGYPTSITLGSSIKSFNAERAEASLNSEGINIKDHQNKNRLYTVWKDGSWINDRLWSHASVVGGGWDTQDGTIWRKVTSEGDVDRVQTIVNTYLRKTGDKKKETTTGTGNKLNNWMKIAAGNEYFTLHNNYVISDGTPIVLIPLQMNTSEGGYNSIYYYYFNPAEVPSGDLTNYIKSLPKFKAIKGYKGDEDPSFKRQYEYLLPFYGNNPEEGMQGSAAIPKGYYIGFLNRKAKSNLYNNVSGCTYGDGTLNYEVNHLVGHYFSALDTQIFQLFGNDIITGLTPSGMDWNSPRIGVFSANNRSYLCFEDGADCNFCDMIVEIKQGTDIILETVAPKVNMNAYTMCFEDRPLEADYDMNDVVLTAEKTDDTHVKLTLLACGAKDDVTLHGIKGSTVFEGNEIHDLLGIEKGAFLNTQVGGNTGPGAYEIIDIGNMTIEEFLTKIYIINEVKHQPVKMPTEGEAPYAIIVPSGFNYPMEGTSISKAYPDFLEWAQNMNISKDWYRSDEGVNRFPLYFIK